MKKEKDIGKTLLTASAALAAGGAVLYAVGQTLNYLFRDVDPKKKEETKTSEERDKGHDYQKSDE